jgi:DNA (cytosine-5)-methyltransferase 1
MYGTSTARPVTEPAGTFTAGGNHHALVMSYYSRDNAIQPTSDPVPTITTEPRHALLQPFVTQFRERTDRNLDPAVDPLHTVVADGASHALVQPYFGTAKEGKPATEPLGTLTTVDRYALLMDNQHSNRSRPVDEAMPTLTTATTKALVHRHNGGGAEMTTPVDEELRTLTTGGNVSLLQTKRQVTAKDIEAARELVPDVLFRMFVPREVAAGMAFPTDYKWQPPNRLRPVSNRDLVKAAGNAVTPPSARDLLGVAIVDLMGAAA